VHDQVNEFVAAANPSVIAFQNRNPDFEDMLRANHLTLEKVVDRGHSISWFHSLTRIVQARRYRQEAYTAFESVSDVLLPSHEAEIAAI
jgi:hypothetical protein